MTAPSCATCRFWQRQGPQIAGAEHDPSCPAEQGACRYAAPVVVPSGSFSLSLWPRTHQDRWCGRWSAGANGPTGGEVIELRRALA